MIVLTSEHEEMPELEREVDEDIAKFDAWFSANVEPTPLIMGEKAILKTYLYWKIKKENGDDTSSGG